MWTGDRDRGFHRDDVDAGMARSGACDVNVAAITATTSGFKKRISYRYNA